MHIYIIQIVHICTGDPAAGSSSFNPRCHQWRWTKSPAILLLRNIKWIGLPFFPTLTCGVFVFSAVSAPPSSRLSSHSHTPHSSSITHTHIPITHTTHSHTFHSHMHHSHTHTSQSHTHTPHIHTHLTHTYITHTLTRTHITHTHTSHTHLTHTYIPITHTTHSHTYHPWSPPLCRWLLRGRRGTWCTAKGSDVCPGVPPVSLRCPSGVPPVSLQCPLVSAALPVAFAWQAWDLVHCKGHGDVSTQLIQIDCLWAYHGLSIHCVCSGHDAGLWHLDNRYA